MVWAPDRQTAVQETGSADAVVAVVGEQPYAEGLGDNPVRYGSPMTSRP